MTGNTFQMGRRPIRVRLGGKEGVLTFLDKNSEQDLKGIVLQVKDGLGIARAEYSNTDADGFSTVTEF